MIRTAGGGWCSREPGLGAHSSPALRRVLQRGAHDLLHFPLVDVNARPEPDHVVLRRSSARHCGCDVIGQRLLNVPNRRLKGRCRKQLTCEALLRPPLPSPGKRSCIEARTLDKASHRGLCAACARRAPHGLQADQNSGVGWTAGLPSRHSHSMAAATAPRVGVLARASARVSRVGFGLQSGWRTDGAASHLFAQPSVSRARPMWSRICVQAKASSDAPAERTTGKMAPERKEKQQLIDLNPPRGTRDFPPEDLRMRQWLFNKFSEACLPTSPAVVSSRPLAC